MVPEMVQQRRVPEAVRVIFLKYHLSRQGLQVMVNLYSLGAGKKEGRSRTGGHVLEMHHRQAFFPE